MPVTATSPVLGANSVQKKQTMSNVKNIHIGDNTPRIMCPELKEGWTQPQTGIQPQTNPQTNVSDWEEDDEDDFGMRYRPHMDKYFLRPERKEPVKLTLEEEWEQEMKKCPHPRWRRENFLGYTYFTCEKCSNRRQQAVAPMSFKMSREEAEDWFDDCFPSFSSFPSSHHDDDRPQRNEWLIRKQQKILGREQQPAGVAKAVSAEDMMQSEAYRRITAQMHTSAEVDSEVQAFARRYTAVLQVFESRLSRNINAARKREAAQRKGVQEESEESLDEYEENLKKEGERKGTKKTSVPRLKVRDMVLGGYFYACVTLQRTMFVEGKVFYRLRLVHHRLRLMFPSLPRDLPTFTYLEALIPRLFPHNNSSQRTILQATALDLIYATARLGLQISKRSLICCSLIAMAAEMDHDLSVEHVRFLQDFDCNYKKWRKVMSVFGQLAGEVQQHMPRPSQPEVEKWLDEDEIAREWAKHKEELNAGCQHDSDWHEGDARKANKKKVDGEEERQAKTLKKKKHFRRKNETMMTSERSRRKQKNIVTKIQEV